jgi:hypothetical protein
VVVGTLGAWVDGNVESSRLVLIPLKYIMPHANLRKFNQVMRIECSTLGFAICANVSFQAICLIFVRFWLLKCEKVCDN